MKEALRIIQVENKDQRFSRAFKIARDQDSRMLEGYVGNAFQYVSTDDVSGIFLQRGKKPKVWLSTYAGKDLVYEPVGPDLYTENLLEFWRQVSVVQEEAPLPEPVHVEPEPKELPEALNLSTVLGRIKARNVLAGRTTVHRPRFEDLAQWSTWAVSLGYELYLVRKE